MDEDVTSPKENPTGTGHLPVSGEVGVGPAQRHDPVTADTDDDAEHQPSVDEKLEETRDDDNPQND
ncbi:MAG TPA: hypothetical protein VFX86_03230 [Candidatus Saccharimonadales bacterium]|nr:hypothetical protein [Candidatus Saccharimonadales bacterium]